MLRERLKSAFFLRHAPATALGLMVGVCVTALGVLKHEWLATLTVLPVMSFVAIYFVRIR
jgi:hypothetical protein